MFRHVTLIVAVAAGFSLAGRVAAASGDPDYPSSARVHYLGDPDMPSTATNPIAIGGDPDGPSGDSCRHLQSSSTSESGSRAPSGSVRDRSRLRFPFSLGDPDSPGGIGFALVVWRYVSGLIVGDPEQPDGNSAAGLR